MLSPRRTTMVEPKPSKVVAAGRAIQLWTLYGFRSPAELVLEDLALALGVLVVEAPLAKADARLIRRGPRGLVRVRHDIPEPGRKRFAVAHELGHWLIHKEQTQVNACTDQNMVTKYKASALEVEANYFAAELLMPEKLFTPRLRKARLSFGLIHDLANEFGTSLTATAIRCAEVTDDYWAIVVSESGRVRWWRGSENFEERFWIEPGMPLSSKSVAGSIFEGEAVPNGPVEIDRDAWADCKEGYDDEVLIEEVFPIPDYDQVLSLLHLP
jgi:Zn-dependent peptidase ImmA (M78 family)